MASFLRAALFFLVLLVAPLFLCSSATTLDEEERQKEEEALESVDEAVSRAAGVPDPPQNLYIGPEGTSVQLIWQAPNDTTDLEHYLVYVEDEDMEDTTTETHYIFNNLEGCTDYTFGVMSVSAAGDTSDPLLGEEQTGVGAPPAPQNLQVDDYTSTTVTLSWNKPDTLCDVEEYRVQWGKDGTDSQSKTTSETSFTVTELSINTSYIFTVIASTSFGPGDEATVQQTTAVFDAGPPENLVAIGVSSSAINVSWSPAPGEPEYYKVTALPCWYLEEILSGQSYLITGLDPCESCDISVTSYYEGGSKYTANVRGTTDGGEPPPPESCSVQVEGDGLTVTWTKPVTDCSLGSYSIQWTGTKLWGDEEQESGNATASGERYYVLGTVPFSQYTFEISASIDDIFGSPASCSGTSSETLPGSPIILAVDPVPGGALVVWETPVEENGLIVNYGIFVDEATDPDKTVNGDAHNTTLELESCKTFNLFVKAMNGAGWGSPSEVKDVTSEGNGPPPPTNCTVQVEEGALNVTWQEPDTSCLLGVYSANWTGTKLWGDEEEESGSDTTPGTMFTLLGPVPYSQYTFEISASTDDVFGSSVSCTGTSLETEPGPPVILPVDSVQGEAVVTWETPVEENGLIVNYGIFVDEEPDPRKTVSGDVHNTSLELDPCKTFGLAVKAKNGAGWGPPSEVKDVTVVDDVLPKKVDCSAADFNVEVCWDPYDETCPVSRYNLVWEGDVLWSEELVDSNSTSLEWSENQICHNIAALPYTKYDVELTVGSGTQSISCFAITPMAAPGPPADVRLTTQNLTVQVAWTEPEMKNGIIDYYQVIWETSTGDDDFHDTKDNSTFSYDILELSCDVMVNVTVRARIRTVVGFGESSAVQTVHLVNSVKTLNCEPSGTGQVSLSWTVVDPTCPISSYNVTWVYESLWSGDTGKGSEDVGKDEISFTVPSLPPYSNVLLQVHVDNSPEYTECVTVTSQEKSSPPTTLKQTANDSSSVTVTWGLPEYIRGELEGWYLRWTTLNDEKIGEDTVNEVQRRTYTISELSKSSTYIVYVSAVNGAGNGEEEETNASTAEVPVETSTNLGLIIGLSTAGGILLIILLVGSIILFLRRGSSKPSGSAPHMPEVADADSDELYKMQQLSSAGQGIYHKHGSVDYGTNSELYMGPPPSLHKDKTINEGGQMPGPPPGRRYSQQVFTSLPRLEAYNRRPSQQVNTKLKDYEEYNRRPSQQDLTGRPSFSGGPGKPSLGEYGRQQIDVGRPSLKEYGRRPSQQVDLGRPNLAQYGRRPSQQVDIGKPRRGEYGRRPSQQIDIGRPSSSEYSRRPSQQLPSGGGSYPSRLPQEEAPRRSSVDLYSRRPSQQAADIGRPGDRMFMKRPSQQFIPSFDGIQEQ